jgi:hypothetical protein
MELRSIALAFLGVCVSGAALAQESRIVHEVSYEFQIAENNNPGLCGRMLGVYRAKFKTMWDAESWVAGDEPIYSPPAGRYAFPRAKDVAHDKRMTFDMRFSKIPSAPEFEKVQWTEGRYVRDASGPRGPALPMLFSYLDFDNDGSPDTVAKIGFTRGYSYMANSSGNGHNSEYLLVWRSKKIDFGNPQSLQPIWNGASLPDRPFLVNGSNVRPLIVDSKTFVASYEMDIGPDGTALTRPPYKPRESIYVWSFNAAPSPDLPPPRLWVHETVCRFAMTQR